MAEAIDDNCAAANTLATTEHGVHVFVTPDDAKVCAIECSVVTIGSEAVGANSCTEDATIFEEHEYCIS